MKTAASAFLITACLGLSGPAQAQADFGEILSGVAQGLLTQELDRQAYDEARRAGTLNGWNAYLERFPQGAHRSEARREITRLEEKARPGNTKPKPNDPKPADPKPGDTALATEAALGLSRAQRQQIQGQLTRIGYDAGVADGLWGQKTRDAIARWQKANDATATGYVTERQLRRISEQAGGTAVPAPGASPNAESEERLLALTLTERRDLQRDLTRLGYATGTPDGVLGRNSRTAIAAWQRDEGLTVTGYITADQLRALRRDAGG